MLKILVLCVMYCMYRLYIYIYDGKVRGTRGRGRPRLAFENTVSKILEDGHVKSMRTPGRPLKTVDEAFIHFMS